MSSCTVDRCCCCIDLKTGCFIIGYLCLIVNLFVLGISALVLLASANYISKDSIEDEAKYVLAGATVVMAIIYFIVSLCNIFFDVILIVGLHENKPGKLKAFLVFSLIDLVTTVIIACFTAGQSGNIIDIICNILLEVYTLVVIRSYLLQMSNPASRVIHVPMVSPAPAQPIIAVTQTVNSAPPRYYPDLNQANTYSDTPAFNPAPPSYNPNLHQANTNSGTPAFNPAPPHYYPDQHQENNNFNVYNSQFQPLGKNY